MLSPPNVMEVKAKGVGTQVWNVLLKCRRKSFSGVQYAGNEGSNADGLIHCMMDSGCV